MDAIWYYQKSLGNQGFFKTYSTKKSAPAKPMHFYNKLNSVVP